LDGSLHRKPPGEFKSLERHGFALTQSSAQLEAEDIHLGDRTDKLESHWGVRCAELESKDIIPLHQDTLVQQGQGFPWIILCSDIPRIHELVLLGGW